MGKNFLPRVLAKSSHTNKKACSIKRKFDEIQVDGEIFMNTNTSTSKITSLGADMFNHISRPDVDNLVKAEATGFAQGGVFLETKNNIFEANGNNPPQGKLSDHIKAPTDIVSNKYSSAVDKNTLLSTTTRSYPAPNSRGEASSGRPSMRGTKRSWPSQHSDDQNRDKIYWSHSSAPSSSCEEDQFDNRRKGRHERSRSRASPVRKRSKKICSEEIPVRAYADDKNVSTRVLYEEAVLKYRNLENVAQLEQQFLTVKRLAALRIEESIKRECAKYLDQPRKFPSHDAERRRYRTLRELIPQRWDEYWTDTIDRHRKAKSEHRKQQWFERLDEAHAKFVDVVKCVSGGSAASMDACETVGDRRDQGDDVHCLQGKHKTSFEQSGRCVEKTAVNNWDLTKCNAGGVKGSSVEKVLTRKVGTGSNDAKGPVESVTHVPNEMESVEDLQRKRERIKKLLESSDCGVVEPGQLRTQPVTIDNEVYSYKITIEKTFVSTGKSCDGEVLENKPTIIDNDLKVNSSRNLDDFGFVKNTSNCHSTASEKISIRDDINYLSKRSLLTFGDIKDVPTSVIRNRLDGVRSVLENRIQSNCHPYDDNARVSKDKNVHLPNLGKNNCKASLNSSQISNDSGEELLKEGVVPTAERVVADTKYAISPMVQLVRNIQADIAIEEVKRHKLPDVIDAVLSFGRAEHHISAEAAVATLWKAARELEDLAPILDDLRRIITREEGLGGINFLQQPEQRFVLECARDRLGWMGRQERNPEYCATAAAIGDIITAASAAGVSIANGDASNSDTRSSTVAVVNVQLVAAATEGCNAAQLWKALLQAAPDEPRAGRAALFHRISRLHALRAWRDC